MPLAPEILEAVANANFKSNAEMATQNAVAHQNRLQMLAETALGRTIDNLQNVGVTEGLGIAAAQRGDLGKVLAELGSISSALQQVIKSAQTTPPPTP